MEGSARVCIIGSGVVGTLLAELLSRDSQRRVTVFEAGEQIPMKSSRIWLDHLTSHRDPFERGRALEDDYANTGATRYPLRRKALYAVGGSGLVWYGISQRLMPEDFQLRTNTGVGFDWPISYDDLEPYYGRAEETLRVAGDARDEGHPPRSSGFPLPAFPYELDDAPFLAAMERLSLATQHQCLAFYSEGGQNHTACETIGTCGYCPIGARFTTDQVLERLATRENVRIRANTAVAALKPSESGRVAAVAALNLATGQTRVHEFDLVVICTGGVEAPKLLLHSKSPAWPHGLANASRRVGRFFMTHPIVVASGHRQGNPRRLSKELEFCTATSRHFDSVEMQRIGKFYLQNWARGHNLEEMMLQGLSKADIDIRIRNRHECSVSAILEEIPEENNLVDNEDAQTRFGLPKTKISYSWNRRTRAGIENARVQVGHVLEEMGCEDLTFREVAAAHPMGTCMMTDDPSTGVVDRDLRLHGVNNVFLCSTAVFPSGGAVNPTLTLVALALRLADHLNDSQ